MEAKPASSSPLPDIESVADVFERSYRRLCYQRIELDPGADAPRATLIGIRHRLPVASPVPPAVAEVLRKRGLPTVVRLTPNVEGAQTWSSATATR